MLTVLLLLAGLVLLPFVLLVLFLRMGNKEPPARPHRWQAASRSSSAERYTVRGGRSVRAGAVFDAWTSGDLHQMLAMVDKRAHAVDRHHLLNRIVEETYRHRADPEMARLCERYAELYLDERADLWPSLLADWRSAVPTIPVFATYCKLLAEQGDFARAIEVCDEALELGLHDGTKGGFEARRARLVKAKSKAGRTPPGVAAP